MLLKTTNIKIGVRLGLLDQDRTRALMFEVDTHHMPGNQAARKLFTLAQSVSIPGCHIADPGRSLVTALSVCLNC